MKVQTETIASGYRKFSIDGRSFRALRVGTAWEVLEVVGGEMRGIGSASLSASANAEQIAREVRLA